jgi:hypothetical protein
MVLARGYPRDLGRPLHRLRAFKSQSVAVEAVRELDAQVEAKSKEAMARIADLE